MNTVKFCRPWRGLLAVLTIGAAPPVFADELTLYVYPSPSGIRWDTPRSLAWSAIGNELATDHRLENMHSIGHSNIELTCEATSRLPAEHVFTGMTSASDAGMAGEILHHGAGLGVLLTTFHGRLETEEDISRELPARYQLGKVSFLRFEISSDNCRRTLEYLHEYRALGYDQYYGLPLRPLYREGGGCTAFAASVLEVAGLLSQEFKNAWSRTIRIPRRLIGGPGTGNRISVLSVLFGRSGNRWATGDEEGTSVFFWDPDEMNRWINAAWWKNRVKPRAGWSNKHRKLARGLQVDATAASPQPGPIWKN